MYYNHQRVFLSMSRFSEYIQGFDDLIKANYYFKGKEYTYQGDAADDGSLVYSIRINELYSRGYSRRLDSITASLYSL